MPDSAPNTSLRTRLDNWRKNNISDKVYLYIVAIGVGIMAGVGACVLKKCIALVTGLVAPAVTRGHINWWLLGLPLVGIILTGIFVRYILRDNIEHGVSQLLTDFKNNNPYLSPRLIYGPIIANTITLGFGGSAGAEGPIAYSSAAMASNLGRWLGLSRDMMNTLVACGAGAGIAAIFKAPIGGVLFTLEVLQLPFTTISVIGLIVCCVTAGLTASLISGVTFDASFDSVARFPTDLLPYALLLGIFCGIYSWYYRRTGSFLEKYFDSLSNPWVRNIISGAILSAMVFLFPVLYGEGYGVLDQVINGIDTAVGEQGIFSELHHSPLLLMGLIAGVLLLKGMAVTATNSGGGVAGDFAPTLFAGSMAGLLFGLAMNHTFGLTLPVSHFALIGMAAVMAGAIKAPLMAMFITVEMTDSFGFLLPVAAAALTSYCVGCMLMPRILSPQGALHHRQPK